MKGMKKITMMSKKGWEIKKLGDCFKLKSGDMMTAKMMSGEGVFPVYGGNGVSGLHNEYNLSGSNVIVGRVGALCGNVRHITEQIWLTDNAFKVVDFKYEFDHSFLTYLVTVQSVSN
jgi:type I restriction enzyme, S subunit